jgi:hypothetical protein
MCCIDRMKPPSQSVVVGFRATGEWPVAFVSGTTAREFVEFLEIRSARGTLPNSSRHADTKCHGEKSRKAGLLGLP